MNKRVGEIIKFHYLKSNFIFSNRTRLKSFIITLIKKEGCSIEFINYIFCSDDYLIRLNRNYLNHDTYTDIITFQFSVPPLKINSEIYISIDRVRDNAHSFNTSFEKELHRVIFHGALHLCGHKDKAKGEKAKMRTLEEKYLNQYFISRETLR